MLTGVQPDRIQRLYGGDLSEVLLLQRGDGQAVVAKGGPSAGTEAQMLRELAAAGVPVPAVEAEYGDVLLIEYVEADEAFTPRAWADIGAQVRALHRHLGDSYGWPVDYSFGSVRLDNKPGEDWPSFWGEQRLVETAGLLDRPWRERVERLAGRIDDLLPKRPPASLLHGDLWAGNMLLMDGRLAAFIDPACYYGHCEVDLAMICLFGRPDAAFWDAYGPLEPGWEQRRPIYQLFPALVHLRLFGASYAPLVERLLATARA
ncbi:MAG: fructosamine kinase family protein [Allosphingosinicella sp.]|uniref:fructosamine kinase family protein n=1 Tax=Allosphingosinicella sp. TaxID=2823234 RepID=UPI0039549388